MNNKIKYTTRSLSVMGRLLLFILLTNSSILSFSQNKTKKVIRIEHADSLVSDNAVVADARRLIGNVLLTHNNIVMKCDSAWAYAKTNTVDAFGNVHIISNDTLNLWAKYINYNGDTEMAKARRKVKLQDPSITLTSDSLDFDMNSEIGYYKYGGKIVDSTNTLTSIIGIYYTRENELFFTNDVRLQNESYDMTTDTMYYNTETQIATFKGITQIIGDSTYIYSTGGWFNTASNETELNKKSTIKRKQTQIQADYLFYNDENGEGFARNNVIINDYENSMIITGQNARYDDFEQYALVTDSAVWMQYYQGDTLFLHADTLYTMPDTSAVDAKMLKAYNKSRFYRTDIQGICDSLVYFTNDSTIKMYNDPVLWSMENQMTAENVEFINKSEPPNEVYLNNNAFIIQEIDSSKFNQIKGKNMVGYIKGESLYRIDVNGNGQSIYYPSDDNDYIGINKAESSNIILYLSDNMIKRITFVGSPTGVMNPIIDVVDADTKLDGFNWRINERPNSRFEIFGPLSTTPVVTTLPETEMIIDLPNINESKIELQKQWDENLQKLENDTTSLQIIDQHSKTIKQLTNPAK
ncbi:MAG TPA: OstA-like protein [Prolixibacteraceae bacterium]|nr:OstA-like protein [Prolixibacteraceae bacterium]